MDRYTILGVICALGGVALGGYEVSVYYWSSLSASARSSEVGWVKVASHLRSLAAIAPEVELPKPLRFCPPDKQLEKTSTEFHSFLQRHQLADPTKSWTSSVRIREIFGEIAKLKGQYVGVLQSAQDGSKLHISSEILIGSTAQGILGLMEGQLGSETESRQFRFATDLRYLEAPAAGKPSAYLMRVSDTSFLQIFYDQIADAWVGNYYSSANSGRYEFAGIARLARR